MAYNLIYQVYFKNFEGVFTTINVSDTTSGTTDTPTPIMLQGTSAEMVVANDEEDKFAIIKSRRIDFTFKSTSTEHLNVFIAGPDNKWLVEVYEGATQVFSGWLVTDATREDFLPPTTYVVSMMASDNVPLLKNVPLTKPDGTNPRGRFRLIEYISWCLRKTGFDLPINVVYNLRPTELVLSGDHTFHRVYLSAKTFEADINTSVDCYEALQKILKGCFLVQENNEWWIVRVDELNGGDLFSQPFAYDGTIGGPLQTITASKNIGLTESIKFIKKDAEVMPERPIKEVRVDTPYEYPRELVDNMDFARGTSFIAPISVDMSFHISTYANHGAFPAVGEFEKTYKATDTGTHYKWNGSAYVAVTGAEIPTGGAYVIEDWTIGRYSANSLTVGSTTVAPYVVKIFQYGDEKARYINIPNTSESTPFTYLRSSPMQVGGGDKVVISVDFRRTTNTGSNNTGVFGIVLYGENGSNYAWSAAGTWIPASSFSSAYFALTHTYPTGANKTEWTQFSADLNPAPVSGELYIFLSAAYAGGGSSVHYTNLQIDYHPFINNSYQQYKGHYHKVSQSLSTKNRREERASIGDMPRPLFKGRLELKTVGGQYYGVSGWYNYLTGTSGELGIASFGKYQAFEYWNQYRRIIRKFQGSLKGLDSATEMPGLLHQYVITAATEHSTNKTFMLLSYSQNLVTCQWEGIFAEVYDSVEVKIYNSDHEKRYLTGNE